jgi:putative methyltransferase (TIGR04325 family)
MVLAAQRRGELVAPDLAPDFAQNGGYEHRNADDHKSDRTVRPDVLTVPYAARSPSAPMMSVSPLITDLFAVTASVAEVLKDDIPRVLRDLRLWLYSLMLRSLVTNLTPPIILRPAQTLWRRARGLGIHTFEGCYKTLADVPCGEGRYDDDSLAEDIASSVERLRTPDVHPTLDNDGRFILPLIVGQYRQPKIMVLDFGGGACTGLRLIADHVPDLDPGRFTYTLVETPALCRAIKRRLDPILLERFKTTSFVEIIDAIPSVIQGRVIVNACSVIQYISNWRSAVTQLASLRPDYFIVGLTPFTDAATYARQQLNIPYRRIATWVFNYQEFLSLMAHLGFKPVFKSSHDLPITYASAPAKSTFQSIVFRSSGSLN